LIVQPIYICYYLQDYDLLFVLIILIILFKLVCVYRRDPLQLAIECIISFDHFDRVVLLQNLVLRRP